MTTETNTKEATVDAVEEKVVEAAAPAVMPPSLTIQDLGNLRNIIDVASKRGAFKTDEFAAIGDTYSKLTAFINAITPPAKVEGAVADQTAE